MYSLIMVDDEIWTLRDMEVLLQAVEGFRLAGAYTNPLEAEAAIRHSPPDVVLTDLRMEEMSGQMLIKAIHECCPQTKIIICSAYRDFDAARDAIKYDVVDYLLKPIVRADFLRAFEKARSLLERDRIDDTAFTRQRVVASNITWSEKLFERIQKEAPCPCLIKPEDDAYALLYYDQSESMEAWIQSLPEGLGFSRELAAGHESVHQRGEALASLCAGFAYSLHKPLDDIQSYIALHCHERLSLSSLASKIGFSSAYLCDLFSKKCGIQLFTFIKRVRIGKACHLLRTTSLPIHEVSRQVGYEDNSHFCREFKHAKGVTPNAYRQTAEGADSAEP